MGLHRNENWNNIMNNKKIGSKNFQRITNYKNKKRSINSLTCNNVEIFGDKEKANIFSDQFEASHELTLRYKYHIGIP